jgi:predicted permease
MDWHGQVRQQLPVITGDPERDRDIQQELADHFADREAELLASGNAPAVVHTLVTRELVLAVRRRRRLGRPPMHLFSDTIQDVRYAARLLTRTPGFALAAIATLALAIGATTALFSVVRGVLLRPLPYPEPDRLVYVWEVSPQGETRNAVAPANYFDWRRRATSFEAIGALGRVSDRALTGSGEPVKVEAVALTAGAFSAVHVTPLHGRALVESDTVANAAPVAILTHGFWMRRFGGEPSVVGQTLTLDDRAHTIVGVMPRGFGFPSPDVDLLVNFSFGADQQNERRSHNLVVIGRLKPGVSVEAADAELDAITSTLTIEHPQFLTGWSTNVRGVHADAVRDARPLLSVLFGVVVAVLLIACANLANLQLARAERRIREMAVRAAIGAGRARMVRQMLAESLVLAAIGGGGGLVLAAVSVRALIVASPADIPFIERVEIDWIVLLAAAASTVASAIAIGIAPALRVARTDVRSLLQGGRVHGERQQQRLRQGLVVAQVAVAVILVVSAALLARTFARLNSVSPGYEAPGVLTVSIDLPRTRYSDLSAQLRFYEHLFERLQAHPSIEAAAGTTAVPGEGASMTFSFAIEGRPSTNPSGREHPVPLQGITPAYFDTMRIPLLRGRTFGATDRPDSPPVVIINETLARRHWPNGDAVGARINFRPGQMPWSEIVGIVGDTRDEGLATPAPATIYVPFAQRASTWAWMTWQTLVVRGRTPNPLVLVDDVKSILWAIDPNLPLLDTATVEDRLAEREARRTLVAALLTAFAALALLLSTIGVYAVMACAVSEGRQEIGIRLALGAVPSAVARRIVLRGVALATVGVVVGVGAALGVTRYLQTLLFEVEATDPLAFGTTVALLLGVATVAAWIPARRAMRVDPVEVLRDP